MKYFIVFSKHIPNNLKPARLAMLLNFVASLYNGWAIYVSTHLSWVPIFALSMSSLTSISLFYFIHTLTVKEFWSILGGKQ